MIRKTSAAILVVILVGGLVYYLSQSHTLACDLCGRHLHQETAFRILTREGTTLEACCPRCGFHSLEDARKDARQVTGVEVADYPSGQLIDARQALYVEGSDVELCGHSHTERDQKGVLYYLTWDRCTPSLLGFQEREAAETFRLQHGGKVLTYWEILNRGS